MKVQKFPIGAQVKIIRGSSSNFLKNEHAIIEEVGVNGLLEDYEYSVIMFKKVGAKDVACLGGFAWILEDHLVELDPRSGITKKQIDKLLRQNWKEQHGYEYDE